MMLGFSLCTLFVSSLVSTIRADPVPTAPGPGDVFKQGGPCTFTWTPDASGVWKVMNVELMTGSNFQMIHLTTVGSFDGTSSAVTSHSYTCPDVTPHSAIYFYQFSSPESGNRTWTTRFAIADAAGNTTPPTEKTQPGNNAPIPWGTGALVNAADAKPAPPNGGGNAPPSAGSPAASTVTPTSSSTPSVTPAASPLSSPTNSLGAAGTTNTSSASAASISPSNAAVAFSSETGTMAIRALCAVGSVAIAMAMFV